MGTPRLHHPIEEVLGPGVALAGDHPGLLERCVDLGADQAHGPVVHVLGYTLRKLLGAGLEIAVPLHQLDLAVCDVHLKVIGDLHRVPALGEAGQDHLLDVALECIADAPDPLAERVAISEHARRHVADQLLVHPHVHVGDLHRVQHGGYVCQVLLVDGGDPRGCVAHRLGRLLLEGLAYALDRLGELEVDLLPALDGEIRHIGQLGDPNLLGYLVRGCNVRLLDLGHRRFYLLWSRFPD